MTRFCVMSYFFYLLLLNFQFIYTRRSVSFLQFFYIIYISRIQRRIVLKSTWKIMKKKHINPLNYTHRLYLLHIQMYVLFNFTSIIKTVILPIRIFSVCHRLFYHLFVKLIFYKFQLNEIQYKLLRFLRNIPWNSVWCARVIILLFDICYYMWQIHNHFQRMIK